MPWWRLQEMTDREVWEYNQRFMIEETTEMMFGMTARDKKIWNAAIEEAAACAERIAAKIVSEEIRKLKK